MLEAIPDPEKATTEDDIELQLQEALVSTMAAIDPSLDASYQAMEADIDPIDPALQADYIALQADYIPLLGLDMEWNCLDVDDDIDTGLF
jgi:hypothetical protein